MAEMVYEESASGVHAQYFPADVLERRASKVQGHVDDVLKRLHRLEASSDNQTLRVSCHSPQTEEPCGTVALILQGSGSPCPEFGGHTGLGHVS